METLVGAEVGADGGLGFRPLYWSAKKNVLRDLFCIDWRSPSVLFPVMLFDLLTGRFRRASAFGRGLLFVAKRRKLW